MEPIENAPFRDDVLARVHEVAERINRRMRALIPDIDTPSDAAPNEHLAAPARQQPRTDPGRSRLDAG
jgi:hypothetical protein